MPWYAIYETATGRLVSVGSVLGDLPEGHAVMEFSDQPTDAQMWDAASKSFVARPAQVIRDRIEDLMADPDIASLRATDKPKIRAAAERLFNAIPDVRRY